MRPKSNRVKRGQPKEEEKFAINDAITNGLDTRNPEVGGSAVYGGKRILGSKDAGKAYAGYFDYQLFDEESNFLPFKVGSYLGTKKVFNIGAGFFYHPNGSVIMDNAGNLKGENVSIFAIDAFYDVPVGSNNSAVTAYATYQSNNYGKDYRFSAYGTGSMLYAHFGYLIGRDKAKTRFQPYLSYASNSYDAVSDNLNILGLGINAYLSGHNAKLTLEYQNQNYTSSTGTLTLQAEIYL